MKKNLKQIFVVLLLLCSIKDMNAQSISFTPNNGQTITCYGTNSSVNFSFFGAILLHHIHQRFQLRLMPN